MRALEHVDDPELGRSVVELGMVRNIAVDDGNVSITISLTISGCPLKDSFHSQIDEHVGSLEGIRSIELGFDVLSAEEKAAMARKLRPAGSVPDGGIALDPSIRILAVASGKGGVGKSSMTVNLAASLSQMGRRVGVIDADIYGHSIPLMLGIDQRPAVVDELIVPPVRHGLKVMSIGFFLEDNSPVMWRGPMLHKALEQFLRDVHWGELDDLIVDMPPGTGDIAISLGQLLPQAEAVVVTTPQPAAQQVAVRAALMAKKIGMRIAGVVENMSYLVDSGQAIFGSGGGQALATDVDAPLLGHVPLDPRLRELADEGQPIVLVEPETEVSRAIIAIAEELVASQPQPAGTIRKRLPLMQT
jgi:ATP-binding protein involved in chromosome partitioning